MCVASPMEALGPSVRWAHVDGLKWKEVPVDGSFMRESALGTRDLGAAIARESAVAAAGWGRGRKSGGCGLEAVWCCRGGSCGQSSLGRGMDRC